MENKNTGLKILIIILSVLVVVLGGYIAYDKVLNNNNAENNNNSVDSGEINYTNIISEISDVFEFVYDYYDTSNTYCGELGTDFITTSKTPSNGFISSAQFTSYEEMIDFLKKYMSEEVIY